MERELSFGEVKKLWCDCFIWEAKCVENMQILPSYAPFYNFKAMEVFGQIWRGSYLCSYFMKLNDVLYIDSICDHMALQS